MTVPRTVSQTATREAGAVEAGRSGVHWLALYSGIFGGCIVTANILAGKLVALPFGLVAPGGVFVFAVTFLLTDTVTEVWGKRQAAAMVASGFFAALLSVLFLEWTRILPAAPAWPHQLAYEAVLGVTPRITAASFVAYLISQSHDIWAFDRLRQWTSGRHLWLRNNLSTMVSQLLDTVVFITLAFGWTLPWSLVGELILGQYVVKWILAMLDTPLCYALVALSRRLLRTEPIARGKDPRS